MNTAGHIDTLARMLDATGRGYPRPQLARAEWQSLNGEWEFAIDPAAEWRDASAVRWSGVIRVPFAPEAPASGVGKITAPLERRHDGLVGPPGPEQ